MRLERKKEHIENYLKSDFTGETLFSDVYIENNALPELNFDEIDTSIDFVGKKMGFPIMINALTGGGEELSDINEDLARIAKNFNIPIAVGSQTIGIEEPKCRCSFEIVRDILGTESIVIGNVSANVPVDYFVEAAKMIDADAMQIHLNIPQEIFMKEGDRNFEGLLDNIVKMNEAYKKPVIVKEVGFGISKGVATRLFESGIKYVDIAGTGGTNFIEIEDIRNLSTDFSDMYDWGIPTAKALIDCRTISNDLNVISSGGIKTAQDIVKSLILGADMVGISGELLSYLMHGGYEAAKEYMESLIYKTKAIMLMLGCKDIKALKTIDYKITGKLKDLIDK